MGRSFARILPGWTWQFLAMQWPAIGVNRVAVWLNLRPDISDQAEDSKAIYLCCINRVGAWKCRIQTQCTSDEEVNAKVYCVSNIYFNYSASLLFAFDRAGLWPEWLTRLTDNSCRNPKRTNLGSLSLYNERIRKSIRRGWPALPRDHRSQLPGISSVSRLNILLKNTSSQQRSNYFISFFLLHIMVIRYLCARETWGSTCHLGWINVPLRLANGWLRFQSWYFKTHDWPPRKASVQIHYFTISPGHLFVRRKLISPQETSCTAHPKNQHFTL